MPIKPPNLDNRRYDDLVKEARVLIPQYCPEWTNLGDADPGMTLVQLFAWMTEMTIFRLNRVPDKTFVHFLNFIGEERRSAKPAEVGLTYTLKSGGADAVELPAFSRASTKQREGVNALDFITVAPITVHRAKVERIVAVHAAPSPTVKEVTFVPHVHTPSAVTLGGGMGTDLFDADKLVHGGESYTSDQYLYIAHDDFKFMTAFNDDAVAGRLRIRRDGSDPLPIGAIFRWEYFTGEESGWKPLSTCAEDTEVLGLPETSLVASITDAQSVRHFGVDETPIPIPNKLAKEAHWIRGVVDYEHWMANRMQEDLEIHWSDDRASEARALNNWDVRATGRTLEFFVLDMPPIRAGWTVRFTLVDRAVPAGRKGYFPHYRWSYRFGDKWETIPANRVHNDGTSIVVTGPFNEMANDGYNLRAERVESLHLEAFLPNLGVSLEWLRPVVLHCAAGPESTAAAPIELTELPVTPFQPAPTVAPLIGMKFFLGSDLLENRAGKPITIELDVAFSRDGEFVEEPKDDYRLQLTARAIESWRVVHSKETRWDAFTFADLDPDGATYPERRVLRFELTPSEDLKSLKRVSIGGVETAWLRLELTRASLTWRKDNKSAPVPVSLHIYSAKIGLSEDFESKDYVQPMPGVKVAMVEHRAQNLRLSRSVTRIAGKLIEDFPFDKVIDLEHGPEEPHHGLYIKFDRQLPVGNRHLIQFLMRGEAFLPAGLEVSWELLEASSTGEATWRRIETTDDGRGPFMLERTGTLQFSNLEVGRAHAAGAWLRAIVHPPSGEAMPKLPAMWHLFLNTVNGANLHTARMEKFSGLGVPHQTIQLRRYPLFLHELDGSALVDPGQFPDILVTVQEDDGTKKSWSQAPQNTLLDASKDDRWFIVDPVEGTLTFGNGVRGRLLPVGNFNVVVDVYHTVPGAAGNVGINEVIVADGYGDLVTVTNLLPANGGVNAESVEQIISRAPTLLTARDRVVTRQDFEIVARAASAEVARAACDGKMGPDGQVEVVVLPHRRPGEVTPDRFLSAGLRDLVKAHLAARCLLNVSPQVRLATFMPIDILITIRLRPNSDGIRVKDTAKAWVHTFLDPYDGGLEGEGWPFQGTLFSADFGRLVKDIPQIRHVSDVRIFNRTNIDDTTGPGWETGQGVEVLQLSKHDLFVLNAVRIVAEVSS